MNNKLQGSKLFESFISFVIAGIAIALLLALLFMFSYVMAWGLLIGSVLWFVALIKNTLFPSVAEKSKPIIKNNGRIIEHDDKK